MASLLLVYSDAFCVFGQAMDSVYSVVTLSFGVGREDWGGVYIYIYTTYMSVSVSFFKLNYV